MWPKRKWKKFISCVARNTYRCNESRNKILKIYNYLMWFWNFNMLIHAIQEKNDFLNKNVTIKAVQILNARM